MTNSFEAGIQAAKLGNNIDNSWPFNHEEFQAGYKTIKPNAKGMFDEINDPESKLKILKIKELSKNG